jgi:threonylcarbamoyladenosine tRNA methylthiotransferase MtaB
MAATDLVSSVGRTRAFVKVQDGCRNRCTFCVVTVARGEERSRTIRDVVDEVQRLGADGYQEIVLTGVHLGGYGRDLGVDLSTLVDALISDTDIPRLRLSSLEPFDLSPAFFALWERAGGRSPAGGGRLMPHLHLPAQSGSDLVLKRMARRNSVSDFEALVAEARAHIPGVTITTDIIVGFPGETEAEFEESLAFARRVGFAHVHIFPYSARAGTAAARFAGRVPETERRRRSRLMNEVGEELGVIVRREFLRQTRPVLFESFQLLAPTDPSVGAGQSSRGTQDVIWSGLTDNYLRVLVHAPAGADLHNRILPTRLLGLAGATAWAD